MKRSLQTRVLDTVVRHSMICSGGPHRHWGFRRRGFSGASAPVSRAACGNSESGCSFLHFHHQLRGADADADEMFVAGPLRGSLILILWRTGPM